MIRFMVRSRNFAVGLLIVFFNSAVLGGELAYTCRIEHIYDVNDQGKLETSWLNAKAKGSQFSVSRVSGAIVGPHLTTLLANSTKVINFGSEDYSFKTVAYFDAVDKLFSTGEETSEHTGKVQVLEVQEFIMGKQKPFIAMSMSGSGIIGGICE